MQVKYERKYKADISQLEKEIEERQAGYDEDIRTIQAKSEESLAQLKDFYEKEKEKQDARIKEERDKALKRAGQFEEEFE